MVFVNCSAAPASKVLVPHLAEPDCLTAIYIVIAHIHLIPLEVISAENHTLANINEDKYYLYKTFIAIVAPLKYLNGVLEKAKGSDDYALKSKLI